MDDCNTLWFKLWSMYSSSKTQYTVQLAAEMLLIAKQKQTWKMKQLCPIRRYFLLCILWFYGWLDACIGKQLERSAFEMRIVRSEVRIQNLELCYTMMYSWHVNYAQLLIEMWGVNCVVTYLFSLVQMSYWTCTGIGNRQWLKVVSVGRQLSTPLLLWKNITSD